MVQEHLLAATVVLAAAVDTTLQMLAAQGSQGKDLREPLALLVTARAAAAAPLWVAFRALLVLLAARVVLVSHHQSQGLLFFMVVVAVVPFQVRAAMVAAVRPFLIAQATRERRIREAGVAVVMV